MKSLKFAQFVFWMLLVFTTAAFAQELPAGAIIDASVRGDRPKASADTLIKTLELASVSSTTSGGLWSSPSTWVGGVVPGAGDDVTIVAGSAVVIDTDAAAGNLTIGDVTLTPAVLTFDPNTARSLTVSGSLTIQNPLGMLTTPSTGTVIDHTVTIGGNLTNNGILDLSTNNNQAGANLVFINATSNAFDGNGSTNDVRAITVNKGNFGTFVIDVSVANFTVRGSTSDTGGSGYLTVVAGTFKISGSFAGNHRTFASANYTVPYPGGFWLNNANYNVTAQNGTATFGGLLHVSAGTVNIGTEAADRLVTNGWVELDGGSINIAGSFKSERVNTVMLQTGGEIHVCTVGNVSPCLDSVLGTAVGGHIYIQNARPVPDDNNPDYVGNLQAPIGLAPTVVHFGTANTPPGARFTASGSLPNFILDTTTGPHTLTFVGNADRTIGDFNIGPGGAWDMGTTQLTINGNTFINNGTITAHDTSAITLFCGNAAFTGTGSFFGTLQSIYIQCGFGNLTLNPVGNGIRARNVSLDRMNLINSNKLTIGDNDNQPSSLVMYNVASLDSPLTFDLGTGGMKLTYKGTPARTAGPEIPPSRTLNELTCDMCTGPITFTGGDLTVNGDLKLGAAVFDMSGSRLIHSTGQATRTTGYVRGTVVRKFTGASQGYNFLVGDNHFAQVIVQTSAPTSNPAFVSVKPIDAALPGLPPATTASFSWMIEQTGTMTSHMQMFYGNEDVNGNESIYKIWRNSPQLPLLYSASSNSTTQNSAFVTGLTSLNGTWGIGQGIPTISISGRVSASNGNGLANATVMLTGGSLAAPRVIQTGPFGTFIFSGVDPGGEYTVNASVKRLRFGTSERIISSWTSVANVDFVANPPQ